SAVEEANSLLGPDTKVQLAASWVQGKRRNTSGIATLYLLNSAGAPSLYMIVVPSDCQCVFLQPQRYSDWIEKHTTALPSMLDVSAKNMLVFMLLHEVGHIVNGDPGEFNERATARGTAITQKEREERADAFAVDVLTSAARRTSDMTAWLNAQKLEI